VWLLSGIGSVPIRMIGTEITNRAKRPGVTRARLITTCPAAAMARARKDLARVDLLFPAFTATVFAADRPLALTGRSLIWRGRIMADTRGEQNILIRSAPLPCTKHGFRVQNGGYGAPMAGLGCHPR
jgi:hypothetical protein